MWDICRGYGKCISRGRGSTRDMFIRAVRRSGRWFPERGCILEHQIFSFGKMILCDRCSSSYNMASLFRGRRRTLDRWSGKTAKRIGTRPSALHSTFHFWRVSQNCFIFDVVNFENCGSLAELSRFLMLSKSEDVLQNCFVFQVQNLRMSRRTAAFFKLTDCS